MDELVLKFKEWVFSSLSTPEPFLNHIPICPYAKDAVLNNRFRLTLCSHNLELFLRNEIKEFGATSKDVVIFVESALDAEEFETTVIRLREECFKDDVWILYDHPALPEIQGNLKFNFDASPVILIQRLSRLVEASKELKKRGYYKNWSKDYEEQVVSLREKFYLKMLDYRQTMPEKRTESENKVI